MSAEYYESALSPTANASDIRLAIKALVVDNTPYGWTHVEDWTESSTTWTVLKCPTTSSGLPNDFHVVIAHPQTAGSEISFFVCEGYDTTAHRMKRPHINYIGTSYITLPSGANGSVGDDDTLYRPTTGTTVAARTAGTGLTANHSTPLRFVFSSTAVIGVAFYDDGLNIALKSLLNHSIYCGAFASYVKDAATNDPMPVGIFGFGNITNAGTSWGNSGNTRSAMNAGLTGRFDCLLSRIVEDITTHQSNVLDASSVDKYAPTEGLYFTPMKIYRPAQITTGPGSPALGGWLRGRLKYYLLGGWRAVWGDTLDIDTDRYMSVSANSSGNPNDWIYIGPVPE